MRYPIFFSFVLLLAVPALAATEPPITLRWEQLIPRSLINAQQVENWPAAFRQTSYDPALRRQEILNSVTTEYDGKRARIPGWIVPLALDGQKVNEFLLVPWFGACIHVPPPPPNQIIFVTSQEPVSIDDIYDPVFVTGVLSSNALSTDLADAGYRLAGEHIEPYFQNSK